MKSKIWHFSSAEFKAIVDESESLVDLLKRLGLKPVGGNFNTVKNRLKKEGIEFESKKHPKDVLAKVLEERKKNSKPLAFHLTENSTYNRHSLKRRLIRDGLLQNICAECGIKGEWNGKPLSLQLDHINGISDDNRIENLRFLCPNCHSQTETFAGKNVSINQGIPKYICTQCKNKCNYRSKSGLCRKCFDFNRRLVDRPPIDELKAMIQQMGYEAVGRQYGVTGAAIKKWVK